MITVRLLFDHRYTMILQKIQKISPKTWIVTAATLALILRIVFVLATPNIGSPASMDAGTYHSIAVNLLEGKGYSEDGQNPSIFVAPLYPLFIFVIYKFLGIHPMLIELIQCFLGIGIGLFTFLIARKYFSEKVSLLAFIVVLFFPDLFVISTYMYTETLFVFLFLALVYSALMVAEKPTLGRIALGGLITGLATLTRGVTMLFPAIFFLVLLFRFHLLKAVKITVLYSLFFVLPIIPWTIRNYVTFHAVVPIAVGSGDVLWTGNYLPFDGKYNYDKTMALMDSMTAGMNQVERDAKLVAEAKKNIAAEPVKSVWLMVRKFFRFWTWVYESAPSGQKRVTNGLIKLVLEVTYYPLLILFLLGLYITRKRWKEFVLIDLLLLYYASLHAVMLVVPRYRIPVIPLMVIFAATAVDWLFHRYNVKRA